MKDKTPLVLGGAVALLGAWALFGRDKASAAVAAPGQPRHVPPVNMTAMTAAYRAAQQSNDPAYIRRIAGEMRQAGREDLARELEGRASQLPGASDVALTEADRLAMADAFRRMGVQDSGEIVGSPSPESIQIATALAGRFESEGKHQAAAHLRQWAQRASARIPQVAPAQQPPPPPGLDADTMNRITRILALERDPARLRAAAALLRNHPAAATPAAQALIAQLEALAVQLEQAQRNGQAAADVERVINEAPGMGRPTPAPAVEAPALTPKQTAGIAMVTDIRRVQGVHGMPGAKGRESKSLVKAYQTAAGLKSDGKAGPGTMTSLAANGVYEIPLVMYWGAGTTAREVNAYRANLRTIAEALNNEADANMLRMVANREKGQAGIVGPLAK